MYLSKILVNLGENPDRPRPGRLWLRNPYRVHQRLCMAFPSLQQLKDDPEFLKPFDKNGFLHVHASRSSDSAFLFRIDHLGAYRTMVLVQSALKPDWDYAFQNARILLAAEPEFREHEPVFEMSEECRFRVLMNLAWKPADLKYRKVGQCNGKTKSQGKRIPLTWKDDENPEKVIQKWFADKGNSCGFVMLDSQVSKLGWVIAYKTKGESSQNEGEDAEGRNGTKMTFRSALIEGKLKVTNPGELRNKVISGIGSAKAFGFGLLSIAR